MSIDPSFGRPFERFAPISSFVQPVAAPSAGPLDGPLVALPCINQDWLKLLLGAAAQLENPSAWKSGLSDATTLLAVQRAQELRAALAEGADCVNPVVQIALDCTNGLQYQTADGVWHVGTNMADICACTTACLVPAAPPNPQGSGQNQHACNIAGYVASEVIQKTMNAMVSYVGTTDQQIAFAHDVLTALGFAFPITYYVSTALYDFYQYVKGQLLAQVSSAASDPTLWSEVTCAIYNAIYLDGYITAANFPAVLSNIASLSYVYPWAITAIHNFMGSLGLVNVQAMQNYGAMDDVDCAGCGGGPWCFQWDFTSSTAGWSALQAGWAGGTGFYDIPNTVVPGTSVCSIIDSPFPVAAQLSEVRVEVSCTHSWSGVIPRHYSLYDAGGSIVYTYNFPNTAFGDQVFIDTGFSPTGLYKNIGIYIPSDPVPGGGSVKKAQIKGPFKPAAFSTNCPV